MRGRRLRRLLLLLLNQGEHELLELLDAVTNVDLALAWHARLVGAGEGNFPTRAGAAWQLTITSHPEGLSVSLVAADSHRGRQVSDLLATPAKGT